MQTEEYFLYYDLFHEKHDPHGCRLSKCREECAELEEAIRSGDEDQITDELIDVMNTSMAALRSRGVFDPLWHGVMKLERTSQKYLASSEE